MKIKFTKSLKFKLGTVVGFLVFIALVITITIFISNTRKLAIENAEMEIISDAENSIISIKSELDMTIHELNLTIQKMNELKNINGVSREHFVKMFENQILNNEKFIGIYTTWEMDKFDDRDVQYEGVPGYYDDGRFVVYWYTRI